ncbi:glutaminase [Nocardioides speluncae]|uniref:glutaminase n=1 Tax=Nocardioides speluncae TaxID=2670337 RepID=UPI000D69E1A2|nr:glutaminase [Nocardioides speluncae]
MSEPPYQRVLDAVYDDVLALIGQGVVARSIPALAVVDPHRFGIALATPAGEVFGAGEYNVPFSIQSISKVFSFGLVLAADDQIWKRVGHEPSTDPYNSLIQLERDRGIPRNPFLNAGALVTTDRLLGLSLPGSDAVDELLRFVRAESGNPHVDLDHAVAASELASCHRNAALAHLIADFGNLDHPVHLVLEQYVGQCALAMSCADVALAARFLATGGLRSDGSRLLPAADVKRLNATMLVCGMYDRAGEAAYRFGLPAKSGVGGGIVAVVPGRCVLCVWSPGLDASGNSVAGVAALEAFSTRTGWSVF